MTLSLTYPLRAAPLFKPPEMQLYWIMQNDSFPSAVLRPKREEPIRAGHPWIFSNAVASVDTASSGSIVEIRDSAGGFLGLGSYHPGNTIRIRVFTRRRESIDESFFRNRFAALREEKLPLLPPETDGYRLAHADADSLPGLIVDIYASCAVFQIHTAGMDRFRETIIGALAELPGIETVVERSDVEARKEDNLQPVKPAVRSGVLSGGNTRPVREKTADATPDVPGAASDALRAAPDAPRAAPDALRAAAGTVPFREHGITFLADVLAGQKTGFFLDQRDAREAVSRVSSGKRVLNLFSYTGGFSLAAAKGGAASVTSVDVSARALDVGREAFSLNPFHMAPEECRWIRQDVFDYLGGEGAALKPDILVCDPPAFAKKRSQKDEAAAAYIRLNRACLHLLNRGGLFLTSSCSGTVTMEEFQSFIRIAAGQAGKDLSVVRVITQPHDHTQSVSFPEGRYLKTILCLVR